MRNPFLCCTLLGLLISACTSNSTTVSREGGGGSAGENTGGDKGNAGENAAGGKTNKASTTKPASNTGGTTNLGGATASGGTTAVSLGGATAAGGTTAVSLGGATASGGTSTSTVSGATAAGGTTSAGGTSSASSAKGGTTSAGGTSSVTTTAVSCPVTVPTATGSFAITSDGYATVGALHGWLSSGLTGNALAPSCMVPVCNNNSTGCAPSVSGTAFCVAGLVAKDPSHNSAAAIEFPLNTPPTGAPGTVVVPNSVTVTVEGTTGIQDITPALLGPTGTVYYDASGWASGSAIPRSLFTTTGQPNSGSLITAATPIQSLLLIVSSSATMDVPFSFCVKNVTIQ